MLQMLNRAAVLAFAGLVLAAQETPPAKEKTVAELEAEKRDPKKRAELLLESAVQASGAVKPETQVAALANIGDCYQLIDRKKAIAYLRQAFTATAALADHPNSRARAVAQASVISFMSKLDVGEAIGMLKQMEPPAAGPDQRTVAAGQIIDGLVQKKDYDTALSVVDALGGTGSFPYRAAQRLFKALPPEDPRRLGLFASATSAYAAKQDSTYGDMLVECWDDLPGDMSKSALETFVKQIQALKEDNSVQTTTLSGNKGAVHFDTKADYELFKVFYLINRVDPKRARELLESRPALRSSIEQFPEGPKSIEVQSMEVNSGNRQPQPGEEASARLHALSESRASAAMAELSKDPAKALSMATTVPSPDTRANLLANIARATADKDPVTAGAALSKCIALLDDIKQPMMRLNAWASVADAAHQLKDPQLAQKALERMLADGAELLRQDMNEDDPNIALRDSWPSTLAYRRSMIAAAKNLGVDAEPLLGQIKDPDIRVLAQVDLAGALLGRPRQSWSVSVNRSKPGR
jgi:hypothetical protein